jgi:hypothetical protein
VEFRVIENNEGTTLCESMEITSFNSKAVRNLSRYVAPIIWGNIRRTSKRLNQAKTACRLKPRGVENGGISIYYLRR